MRNQTELSVKARTNSLFLILLFPAMLLAQPQEVIDAYNLNSAIQSGNAEKVRESIKSESNVNFQYNGRNALHTACNKGNPEIAKLLIDAGAEINSISEEGAGRTALQMVCGSFDPENVPELVEELLLNGADPDLARDIDQYPLFESINRGHAEAVKLLLEHGASTSIINSMDQGPLEYANFLLKRGVSEPVYKENLKKIQSILNK